MGPGLAQPVIGLRFARTRWFVRNDSSDYFPANPR